MGQKRGGELGQKRGGEVGQKRETNCDFQNISLFENSKI